MKENEIAALISDGETAKPTTIRFPQKLLDLIEATYLKKVGAVRKRGITTDAVLYFAALGVLTWLGGDYREDRRK